MDGLFDVTWLWSLSLFIFQQERETDEFASKGKGHKLVVMSKVVMSKDV